MILVDTSVWINHLRENNEHLKQMLLKGRVMCHEYIVGELACGNIKNRKEILTFLKALPAVPLIDFNEYLYFVEEHQLNGSGIGFVDIHLLASTKLSQTKLWTEDKRLKAAASKLGINFQKR